MPLTITVTLEDDDVQHFIDQYNDDSGTDITADMVNQNKLLQEAMAEDMVASWFTSFLGDDSVSAYDLYSEFFENNEVVTLPGDPVLSGYEGDDDER